MTTFQWLTFIIALITDESKHFALSAFTGLLGFALTWTTLYVLFWALERLTQRDKSTAVGRGILISCLLVGLSFALASHWLLDYGSVLLTTPLGPPLMHR